MSNWPQCESKARWKAPAKETQGEKSEVKIEKIMPNEAYGDEIYLSSLILTRHWRFELGEKMT
jgi:hypothetical protein